MDNQYSTEEILNLVPTIPDEDEFGFELHHTPPDWDFLTQLFTEYDNNKDDEIEEDLNKEKEKETISTLNGCLESNDPVVPVDEEIEEDLNKEKENGTISSVNGCRESNDAVVVPVPVDEYDPDYLRKKLFLACEALQRPPTFRASPEIPTMSMSPFDGSLPYMSTDAVVPMQDILNQPLVSRLLQTILYST